MDMDEKNLAVVRRENLRKWMDQRRMKSGELATAIGSGRAYASLLFREDRHFGEKAARNIEQKLRMPDGYLDSYGATPITVADWGAPGELQDGVYALVPRVEIRINEETGVVESVICPLPPMAFTRRWMLERGITQRDALRFCVVGGVSMDPLLHDGDLVMVDTAQHGLVDGGMYAIRYGREIRVRKLFSTLDGGIRIHAVNAEFPDEVVRPDAPTFQVLGRKVWLRVM